MLFFRVCTKVIFASTCHLGEIGTPSVCDAFNDSATRGRRRVFSYVNSLETPERKLAARKRKQDIYINVVIPRIVRWISTLFNSSGNWVSLVSCSPCFVLYNTFHVTTRLYSARSKQRNQAKHLKPPSLPVIRPFLPFNLGVGTSERIRTSPASLPP